MHTCFLQVWTIIRTDNIFPKNFKILFKCRQLDQLSSNSKTAMPKLLHENCYVLNLHTYYWQIYHCRTIITLYISSFREIKCRIKIKMPLYISFYNSGDISSLKCRLQNNLIILHNLYTVENMPLNRFF